MSANTPARIGVVGTGWRTGMFLTVITALPELFRVEAALTRSAASAERFEGSWGVPTTTDADAFLRGAAGLDFVLVSVSSEATPGWVRELAARGIPALVETPLATELDTLLALVAELPAEARVQVSEQYRFQPQHAARLAVAHSGLLGTPRSAFSSAAHFYHGISLLRGLLGVGFERLRITASSFDDPVLASLGRDGWDAWDPQPEPRTSERVSARLELPERGALAVYDFNEEQYFSPVRTRHVSVAGERGELVDDALVALRGPADVLRLRLEREATGADGDLEGSFLRRIMLGERVVYENPLAPARLSDDEIAIGTVLLRMAEYARGGAPFYGVADAAEDQYLSLLTKQALATGRAVEAGPRPWAGRPSVTAR